MRIVWITPFPPLKDGLASYSAGLVAQLRRSHEVEVVTPPQVALLPWRFLAAWRRLRAMQPEVIHVQYVIPSYGLGLLGVWALLALARWRLNVRVVVTFHEVGRETALLKRLGLVYYRLITRGIDAITVHTYEAVDILVRECNVSRERVSMVPHPLAVVPTKAGDPAELDKVFDIRGNRIVLFFGFIHVDKGIDYLIKAFDIARRSEPSLKDARLVIAGSVRTRKNGIFKWFERLDRRYEASLHELVAKRHLKRAVIFTPYVPEAQVSLWFRRASVVVLPYTNLEQSGVVNQALAYKTPIIASALGGLKETLDGTPALVPAANAGALATKLSDYLQHPEVSQTVAASYAKIRRPRTLRHVARQLEAVYGVKND